MYTVHVILDIQKYTRESYIYTRFFPSKPDRV